jgi:hypothetical protein
MGNRELLRRHRVDRLIEGFGAYLDVHVRSTVFSRTGQLEDHVRTIERRKAVSTVGAALDDEAFLQGLWDTLRAWGIGIRASRLVPFDRFVAELKRWRDPLERLDGKRLEVASESDGRALWRLVDEIDIIKNEARVVALTKTLHHLLPDLLPPIDRAYTGAFFGWHVPEFQTKQREIFGSCWASFLEIARSVDLGAYVGTAPWNTSCSKVVDNAIVGFCLAEGVTGAGSGGTAEPSVTESIPRRESWTVELLEADLREFASELRAAGLKPNTIDTYVGRANTFIRWLDGKYETRGPNV